MRFSAEQVQAEAAALVDRGAGRDLYDAHRLLSELDLDAERLRVAFTVAAAQASRDASDLTPDSVRAEPRELRNRLIPLLRRAHVPGVRQVEDWIERLIDETRSRMAIVLPFSEAQQAFLKAVNERGEIRPELLTDDPTLSERILAQPGLRWKVLNVRRHLGLDG